MSGIGEALAIIGAAAALVTACKDGGTIARQIAKRRKARGAPPPTELLEKSLDKGQIEIKAKIEEGSEAFGVGFKNGDNLAVQALKDVTIEMQAALLRHLLDALEDDSKIDFLACERSVTRSRLRAINALNDLYQRQSGGIAGQSVGAEQHSKTFEMPPLSSPPTNESITPSQPSPSDASAPSKRSHALRKVFSKDSRRNTTASIVADQSLPDRTLAMTRVQTLADRDPPVEPRFIESRRSTFSTIVSTDSARTSDTYQPITRRSTATSTSTTHSDSMSIFCQGAQYVQASPDPKTLKLGFKLHRAAQKKGFSYFWRCQSNNCVFEGKAWQDDQEQWQYDETIRWSTHGIGFRWLFLAKSHVKTTKKTFKRESRCLICARGGQESREYSSDDQLLDHIARKHCGTRCMGLLLRGPICFDHNGLSAGSKETFDILFPENCPEHFFNDEPVPSSSCSTVVASEYAPSVETERLSIDDDANADVFDNPWR